jgi:hypothetical protein
LLKTSTNGIPVDSASTRNLVSVAGSGLGWSSENRTTRRSTLATGGSATSVFRSKTSSIIPRRSVQSTAPTRTRSPTSTRRRIFLSSARTTQSRSDPRWRSRPWPGGTESTMTRMKLACDAATRPVAWVGRSESGGGGGREAASGSRRGWWWEVEARRRRGSGKG